MGIFSFFSGGNERPDEPQPAATEPSAPDGQPPASAGPGWNFGALAEERASPMSAAAAAIGASDPVKTLELKPHVIEAICTVFDPEIPVNIYELGLIYDVIVDADAKVLIRMTLTSPACPSAQSLPGEVQWKVKAIPGVSDAVVEIVWEPPWTPEKMSDVARLQLGMF